jgi:hypothetical protein
MLVNGGLREITTPLQQHAERHFACTAEDRQTDYERRLLKQKWLIAKRCDHR